MKFKDYVKNTDLCSDLSRDITVFEVSNGICIRVADFNPMYIGNYDTDKFVKDVTKVDGKLIIYLCDKLTIWDRVRNFFKGII